MFSLGVIGAVILSTVLSDTNPMQLFTKEHNICSHLCYCVCHAWVKAEEGIWCEWWKHTPGVLWAAVLLSHLHMESILCILDSWVLPNKLAGLFDDMYYVQIKGVN